MAEVGYLRQRIEAEYGDPAGRVVKLDPVRAAAILAALERIPEPGTIEELRQQVQRISALAAEARDERDRWRLRAERVEAVAARVLDAVPFMDNFEDWNGVPTRLLRELRAALAAAPPPARPPLGDLRQVVVDWWAKYSSQPGPPEELKADLLRRIEQVLAAAPASGEVKGDGGR